MEFRLPIFSVLWVLYFCSWCRSWGCLNHLPFIWKHQWW